MTQGILADIIVCEMNLHIDTACKPIFELLPLLAPGGLLIVTLKFFGSGREPRKCQQPFEDMLAAHGVVGCKFCWCLANTSYERTLIAHKAV